LIMIIFSISSNLLGRYDQRSRLSSVSVIPDHDLFSIRDPWSWWQSLIMFIFSRLDNTINKYNHKFHSRLPYLHQLSPKHIISTSLKPSTQFPLKFVGLITCKITKFVSSITRYLMPIQWYSILTTSSHSHFTKPLISHKNSKFKNLEFNQNIN